MTIDEAVKTLSEYTEGTNPWGLPNLVVAAKLGIEALKRIKNYREWGFASTESRLPGETKE